ncbi:MAG: sigma-54-dependent Fis family transcriptional regulator [Deltaproteobacteria bacterium]|nr:sigma-54-dependent Fis family transcriptional regulator [Deltaproteobacteria bacterium]
MNSQIIVIDDEQDFLDSVKRGLGTSGYRNIHLVPDPRQALSMLEQGEIFDLALIDITMPWMDGVTILEFFKRKSPATECLMITSLNDAKVAVECLKKGAYDYILKPLSRDGLISAVKRALERKRLLEVLEAGRTTTLPELFNKAAFCGIVTQSEKMLRLLKEAELHAISDVPVLITGESGTGKELLAEAIHRCSDRNPFPFTPINMASLSGSLFDAEFFGHTKGAFTGAEKDRKGFLEHTHRGTLFLDEIGDLPHEFQGKLLRVLQNGEFIKLGDSNTRKVDIRIIAATNRNLERLMSRGVFRGDLYWRLKGAWLHIPALRERKDDIPILISSFLQEVGKGKSSLTIDEEALAALSAYEYPGNVRELRSILYSAANLTQGHPISLNHLPENIRAKKPSLKQDPAETPVMILADMEKEYILRIYEQTNRNKFQAAKLLGIGLNTLRRKLMSYNMP